MKKLLKWRWKCDGFRHESDVISTAEEKKRWACKFLKNGVEDPVPDEWCLFFRRYRSPNGAQRAVCCLFLRVNLCTNLRQDSPVYQELRATDDSIYLSVPRWWIHFFDKNLQMKTGTLKLCKLESSDLLFPSRFLIAFISRSIKLEDVFCFASSSDHHCIAQSIKNSLNSVDRVAWPHRYKLSEA